MIWGMLLYLRSLLWRRIRCCSVLEELVYQVLSLEIVFKHMLGEVPFKIFFPSTKHTAYFSVLHFCSMLSWSCYSGINYWAPQYLSTLKENSYQEYGLDMNWNLVHIKSFQIKICAYDIVPILINNYLFIGIFLTP